MKKMTLKNENYKFNQVVKIIESTKERVYKRINEELIEMYFSIGEFISKETKEKDYGDLFIEKLAIFFKERYPELKGFSETNLYRMKKFYELYFDNNDVKVLLPCICWSNHVKIMSSCKNMEERIFYMQMCIKDRLSKRELIRQIDSSYYERYVLSNKALMPSIRRTKKATKNIFLDQYVLDFLNLTSKEISESELEKSIVDNMRDFILEIGKDFTFIKEQYPIEVGDQKFYVDLLFYHRKLSCLVAFELKVGDFKPEYISKMDFYLEALDRRERNKNENPSVGIILCAGKNDEVVEYALSRTLSPTMVAEYNLQLIDKKLLTNKLREYINLSKNADN